MYNSGQRHIIVHCEVKWWLFIVNPIPILSQCRRSKVSQDQDRVAVKSTCVLLLTDDNIGELILNYTSCHKLLNAKSRNRESVFFSCFPKMSFRRPKFSGLLV